MNYRVVELNKDNKIINSDNVIYLDDKKCATRLMDCQWRFNDDSRRLVMADSDTLRLWGYLK